MLIEFIVTTLIASHTEGCKLQTAIKKLRTLLKVHVMMDGWSSRQPNCHAKPCYAKVFSRAELHHRTRPSGPENSRNERPSSSVQYPRSLHQHTGYKESMTQEEIGRTWTVLTSMGREVFLLDNMKRIAVSFISCLCTWHLHRQDTLPE